MPAPTAVNDQITDSVTQSDADTLGDSPALAMGQLYQSVAQATSIAAENAAIIQQQDHVAAQAATTAAVTRLLGAEEHT